MSDKLSSPSRGPNKVTYASGRAKRKRATRDASYVASAGESDGESEEEESTQSAKATRSETKMATRTPKKVDVHLPGPSPRRAQNESADQSVSAKKPVSTRGKRGAHSRAASVASLAREDTLVDDGSPTKPLSSASVKPRSQIQCTDTVEDGGDDVSSIGESSRRARKTEAERRQFFEDDPNSGDVEPHRVFCKACNEWVDLNPKRKYIMKLWIEHRKRCKGNSEQPESPSKEKEEAEADDDDASVAGVSVAETAVTGIKRVKKEEDRKAIIEGDPLAGEVKPDMAFCKGCNLWVKLSKETRYSLHPWRNHAQKCSGGVPSTRVATAQRKLKLVNDPQMKTYSVRSVDCKFCNTKVDLDGKVDYDLTKWDEHKATCTNPAPPPPVIMLTADTSVKTAPRPPPSVASTDETVVATELSTPQKNAKRSREDDDLPDRAVRQRGESYEPPQGDSPGFLNWITAPFKNFFRGFREGLSG